MRLCADYGTDAPLHLVSAILLYGSKDALYGNNKIRLATVHTPEPNPAGGPPLLGEGQPVSKSFLEKLSRSLQSELPAGWLPENVLIWSQRLAAWWEPARIRAMFFSPESDGKTLDGKLYPHPALLFAIRDGRLPSGRSLGRRAQYLRPSSTRRPIGTRQRMEVFATAPWRLLAWSI